VAELHGEVSRDMFRDLWPDFPADEVPIGSITNGVHAHTWTSPEIDDILTRYVRPEWHEAGPEQWARVAQVPDDELWRAREQGRERLVAFVRRRLRESPTHHNGSAGEVSWADQALDPRVLTIGFARRFATYKRANLLLTQSQRLRNLLLSTDQPVQFVFAGKAHPADEDGKEMIRQIVAFAGELDIRHRFVFVDDYDIAVARALYHGADVWLNNPRRPQEACGTSGMKSALTGGLNLSILDGWWAEMFDGENGWAIASAEQVEDIGHRDQLEANSIFDLLETQVVPLFYDRLEGPVPRRWVDKVQHSLASLGHQVSASRMVRDYTERLYEPTAARVETLMPNQARRAVELAGWKQRVRASWHTVHVDRVDADADTAELGAERSVEAAVALGELSPDDVDVQLLHGRVGPGDELSGPSVTSMVFDANLDEHHARYRGSFTCDRPGRFGFTVRVVPHHPDLASSAETGLAAWA
jgi:glycogen phosphorylase